jgi:hypothetical protein
MASRPAAGDEPLREELLALAAADRALRARLVTEGTLVDGYHPGLAALHHRHAARLAEIVASRGWPGRTLVGDDGAEAAWRLVQHAIGDPPVMRRCLPLLEAAAGRGEVPAWQPAYLLDRIRTLEGRPQRYGTQHDWDAGGELAPRPLEDPVGVDARRAAVGLGPLGACTAAMRAAAAAEGERAPADPAARQRAFEAWSREVGWR